MNAREEYTVARENQRQHVDKISELTVPSCLVVKPLLIAAPRVEATPAAAMRRRRELKETMVCYVNRSQAGETSALDLVL